MVLKMKTCPDCGAELKSDAKFCKKCGCNLIESQDSERQCPKCNARVPHNKKFCGACGTSLVNHHEVKVEKESRDDATDAFSDPVRVVEVVTAKSSDFEVLDKEPEVDVVELVVITEHPVAVEVLEESKLFDAKTQQSNEQSDDEAAAKNIEEAYRNELVQCDEPSMVRRYYKPFIAATLTAIVAAFGISWYMASESIEAPQKATQQPTLPEATPVSPQRTEVLVPPQQPIQPVPNEVSVNPIQNTPAPGVATAPTPAAGVSATQTQKKTSQNQQDINRQRLLELKRQLGQQ